MPVWCKLPEDDLKKIETCPIISGFYVMAYILMFVYVFLLYIKCFRYAFELRRLRHIYVSLRHN